uniref:Transmembrane protein 192 n=1 Tax=Xenopus tropicalis TaxID=8364 RepID=A0A6I8SZ45_XENTR
MEYLTQSADEDGFLDAPLLPSQKLQSVIRPHFHPVPTICISILLALVNLAYVTLAVVAIYFCLFSEKEKKCKQSIDPFQLSTVLVISKLVLWLLHVVNERFAQHHHCKARSRGFLHLYRSTRHLKALPLIIHSTGNAALLLILSVQDSFTSNSQLYPCLILSVLLLELILSVICLIIYTVRIYRFNKSKPRPDIIEEEKINAFHGHVNPEIGFRHSASLEEVVEKQGDTIEYLKHHNALLSKQLLALASNQD